MTNTSKATISVRKYIKWEDEPPSEPTSTLVLTSPNKCFVDTRLLLPTDSTHPITTFDSIKTIEWAFAGTSSSTPATADKPEHTVWTHWVDSNTPDGESIKDEGDMVVDATGEGVERGEMVNPATGKAQKYEEGWRDIKPLGEKVGWVLKAESKERKERGIVVRLGGFAQGILRRGDDVGIKRWRYLGGEEGWEPIIAIGPLELPTEVLGESSSSMKEGDVFVSTDELRWVCVERFEGDW